MYFYLISYVTTFQFYNLLLTFFDTLAISLETWNFLFSIPRNNYRRIGTRSHDQCYSTQPSFPNIHRLSPIRCFKPSTIRHLNQMFLAIKKPFTKAFIMTNNTIEKQIVGSLSCLKLIQVHSLPYFLIFILLFKGLRTSMTTLIRIKLHQTLQNCLH